MFNAPTSDLALLPFVLALLQGREFGCGLVVPVIAGEVVAEREAEVGVGIVAGG